MDTESKLNFLRIGFPEIENESILEMLILCDGSLAKTEELLVDQTGHQPLKRKIKEDEEKDFKEENNKKRIKRSALYQSSLRHMLKNEDVRVPISTTSKSLTLYTKEDIEATVPYVKFYKNFLPHEVADSLLQELVNRRGEFKSKEFFIAGNHCVSNHKSALFYLDPGIQSKGYDEGFYGAELERSYSDYMTIAQFLVEDKMDEIDAQRTKHDFEIKSKWKGDLCVGNLFEANSSNLDWHSDKLTHIGPLPSVCSLSLGATRDFRLRKIHPAKENHNPIINIPLPHNTLLVMGPGCQEEYKHCVPPMTGKGVDEHPLSGSARYNLTFRMYHPCLDKSIPKCPKCRNTMILRRMFKDVSNRGKYFWSCGGSYKNAECKGFYWADFRKFKTYDDTKDKDKVLCLYTHDEKEASEWIADDDTEKLKHDMLHH